VVVSLYHLSIQLQCANYLSAGYISRPTNDIIGGWGEVIHGEPFMKIFGQNNKVPLKMWIVGT
jgi:hypothetical protein